MRARWPMRPRAASISASVGPVRIAIGLNSEHLLEDLADRRQRIELPTLNLAQKPTQLGILGHCLLEVMLRPRARDREDLAGEIAGAAVCEEAACLEIRTVLLDL